MTLFRYSRPDKTGIDRVVAGVIEFSLVNREEVGGRFRTQHVFSAPLDPFQLEDGQWVGQADVTLPTTGPTQGVRVRERLSPNMGGRSYTVVVPNPAPVFATDLVEVDPATLIPSADSIPAWEAITESIGATLTGAQNAASQAESSAITANASAGAASDSAAFAASVASSVGASVDSAAQSASDAAGSATESATYATNAAGSATDAAGSATAAEAARQAAADVAASVPGLLTDVPTREEVAGTYETQAHASATYEPASHAAATYETQAHAGATYPGVGEFAAYSTVRLLDTPTRDIHILTPGDSTHLFETPWPRQLGILIAAPRPWLTLVYHKWNDANGTYDTAETIQTGTGPWSLHIWNLAMSGKTSTYYLGGAPWSVGVFTPPAVDCIIYSQGWNEPATADFFATRVMSSIESLRTVWATADVLVVAENAGTPPLTQTIIDNQTGRAATMRRIAAQRGYGLIDAHNLFARRGDYSSWMQADGIHPNELGRPAIAALAAQQFQLPATAEPKPIQPPAYSVASDNLLSSGLLEGWDGTGLPPSASGIVGTGTVSKDTTVFETKGYSVKLTASAASTYLYFDLPLATLPRIKRGWVNFAARVYVPSGQTINAGRVAVDQSSDSTNSSNVAGIAGEGYDTWRWSTIRAYVTPTATRLRARVYAAVGADTTGGIVYVDRVSLVTGTTPREAGASRGATAAAAPAASTGFGFPASVDTALVRGSDSQTISANRAIYMRCRDGGTISKVGLGVVVASGNVSVAAYSNSGTGRNSAPGALLASSGSVACPAAGYAEIALGTSVTLNPGDWLAICPDNVTASFRSGLTGLLTHALGQGRGYVRDNSFPLAGSNPTSLQAAMGPPVVLVGVE